jgi:hypothetical protein
MTAAREHGALIGAIAPGGVATIFIPRCFMSDFTPARLVRLSAIALVIGASACGGNGGEGPGDGTGGSSGTGGRGAGGSASGGATATGGAIGTGGTFSGGAGGGSGGGGAAGDAGGAGGSGPLGTGGADTTDAASADGEGTPGVPTTSDPKAPCPKCVRIFNGMNFDGWEASASTWKIVDGAMRGQGGTSRAAYTKADYGNVRLIFTSRMNPINGDHLGVLFWGNRPTNADKPEINNAGWIQWMPNYGGLWSYYPPKDRGVPSTKVAASPSDWMNWHTSEILLNLDKGTLRAATDGVEVTRYTHPFPTERMDPAKRIIKGPIAMMKHGGGGSEYKDIWVEVDPTEDKLATVK